MKHFIALGLLLIVSCDMSAQAQTSTDLNEGVHLTADATMTAQVFTWWGRAGRTYFVQQSYDLTHWIYVPVVCSGGDAVDGLNFTCTDVRQFWRMKYTDEPTGGNAEAADFDYDGLTNLSEVSTYHTDPFAVDTDGDGFTDADEVNNYHTDPANSDTDGDGMDDFIEFIYNLNPLSAAGDDGAGGDPDHDGLTNLPELTLAFSDPHDADTDDDTLNDGDEYLIYGSSPTYADTDGDLLTDADEVNTYHTNPASSDTDDDGMNDRWEVTNSLNANSAAGADGANGDPDDDGLENFLEYAWGADPHDSDTDDDTLTDAQEIVVYFTTPWNADCDYDGLNDGAEVLVYLTDPWNSDTDGDTLNDGAEVQTHGTNPTKMDTDGDWMWDDWEVAQGFNPLAAADAWLDADSDGLSNVGEFLFRDDGYDPHVSDAADFDWQTDTDFDGLTNQQELQTFYTNPLQPDTDDDGLEDGWEIAMGFSAVVNNDTDGDAGNDASTDTDGDGLSNADEAQNGTNPNSPDSDSDGVNDADENLQGSNPNDPNDSQPPPGGTVRMDVTFGDPSESHSEKYRVILNPTEGDTQIRQRSNRNYGGLQTDTFRLRKGAKYLVTLLHIGTDSKYRDQPRPDYDYTLEFVADPQAAIAPYFKIDDPDGIMGGHGESDSFFADGKSAMLYLPKIEWVTPANSPVTAPKDSGTGQNEFTYDASSSGVLTLYLKAKVTPAGAAALIAADCFMIVPDIIGSTMAWTVGNGIGRPIANTSDEIEATVTFTTLPSANSAFGKKTVQVYLNSSKEAETEYEVFFMKDETNHPGGGPYPGPRPKNWYFYWTQTNANNANTSMVYAQGTIQRSQYTYLGSRTIQLADDAASQQIATWGTPKGVDCFAWTTAHEAKHHTQISSFWPTTWIAANDLDSDWLPDVIEPTYMTGRPYDPTKTATYPDGVGYNVSPLPDVEDICMRSQTPPFGVDQLWTNGAANSSDWANPGKNSTNQY